MPLTNPEAAGIGIGVISIGRKLLRFVVRVVGDGSASRFDGEGGGCGDLGSSISESFEEVRDTSGMVGGGDLRSSSLGCLDSLPSEACNSAPVVEIRTSICGVKEFLNASDAEAETVRGMGAGRDCEGSRGRTAAEDGRDIAGASPPLILPIDIFFKKPHLVDLVSSFPRAGVSSLYRLSRSRLENWEPIGGSAPGASSVGSEGRFFVPRSLFSAGFSFQTVGSIAGRLRTPSGDNAEDTPKLAKRFGSS